MSSGIYEVAPPSTIPLVLPAHASAANIGQLAIGGCRIRLAQSTRQPETLSKRPLCRRA